MNTSKVSEAQGPALNWMVAKAEGKKPGYEYTLFDPIVFVGDDEYDPSADWSQGGPIIEREGIGLLYDAGSACRKPSWFATTDDQCTIESYEGEHFDPAFLVAESAGTRGPTPLIAAMRCYVVSKLGETVEVPEELL